MKNLKLGLLAILTCASISVFGADDSLQIHGYGIVAGDFKSDLTRPKSVALHIDPTGPNLDPMGKLGNLGNSYWHDYFTALSLNKKWSGKNGQWADYTYEFVGYGNKSVETGQNFIRFGGLSLLPEGSSMWAGRRSFSEGVSTFAYNTKNLQADSGIGYNGKNLDIILGSCAVNWSDGPNILAAEGSRNFVDVAYRIGKSELEVTYVKELDDPILNGEKQTAISFSGKYNLDKFLGVMPGNTMVKAQFGKGVIAQFLNTSRISSISEQDDTSMRFTIDGKIAGVKDFTINPAVILERTDRDAAGKEVETGLFAGVSASQKINDNLSMVYEVNINDTQNKDGVDGVSGIAYKIAAGPALQLEVNEWVRPIMKVSAAIVGGDKDISGLTKDSEVRVGYQLETWF